MPEKFNMTEAEEKYTKDVDMLMSLVSGSDGEGLEPVLEGMDSMIYALEAEDIAGSERSMSLKNFGVKG